MYVEACRTSFAYFEGTRPIVGKLVQYVIGTCRKLPTDRLRKFELRKITRNLTLGWVQIKCADGADTSWFRRSFVSNPGHVPR